MPRPKKCRRVERRFPAPAYKPQGIPMEGLSRVTLHLEEMEALRLADADGLDHGTAADRMGISRPTFSRILASGRRTVARALANGWAIQIDGGVHEIGGEAGGRGCGGRRRKRGRLSEDG